MAVRTVSMDTLYAVRENVHITQQYVSWFWYCSVQEKCVKNNLLSAFQVISPSDLESTYPPSPI